MPAARYAAGAEARPHARRFPADSRTDRGLRLLPDYTIDARTAIELLVVGNLLAAGLFLVHRQPGGFPYLYVFGRLAQTTGWLLFLHRPNLPYFAWYVLGNSFLLLGWLSEVLAISKVQATHRRFERAHAVLAAIVVGHLLVNWALGSSVSVVNFTVSLVLIAIFLLPASRLLRTPGASPLRLAVGSFYLMFCLINGVRALYALQTDNVSLMTGNLMHSLWFVVLFALLLVGNIGYILLLKEDTDRRLLHAATTDPLTGVANRRALFEEGERRLMQRDASGSGVAVLMFDLDHFKRINDTHGHAMGDRVLRAFAACAREQLRPGDLFGRLGGEEFCAVLIATPGVAREIAERIRTAVERLDFDPVGALQVTVSIGMASARDSTSTLEALLQAADARLYEAKASGRNRLAD